MDQPTLPNLQNRLPAKQQLPGTSGQIASIQCHPRCNSSYYISFSYFTPGGPRRAFVLDEIEPNVRRVSNTLFSLPTSIRRHEVDPRLMALLTAALRTILAQQRSPAQTQRGLSSRPACLRPERAKTMTSCAPAIRKRDWNNIFWFRTAIKESAFFPFTANVGSWHEAAHPACPLSRQVSDPPAPRSTASAKANGSIARSARRRRLLSAGNLEACSVPVDRKGKATRRGPRGRSLNGQAPFNSGSETRTRRQIRVSKLGRRRRPVYWTNSRTLLKHDNSL